MKQPILLDTCAVIFSVNQQLKPAARDALDQAEKDEMPIYISPITAWEIGMLVARGRLTLTTTPENWFSAVIQSGAKLSAMSPEVLIASSFLPGSNLRDPADRIVAATARNYGYRLMTRDGPLLDYASKGHLSAIGC